MLTPQEVSSKTFPKAVMGGYAMASVDEFLDALTEDYTNLYKENAALKGKVKALMEKMEEYRQVDDAMRSPPGRPEDGQGDRQRGGEEAGRHRRRGRGAQASLVADAETVAKERMAELKPGGGEEQRLRPGSGWPGRWLRRSRNWTRPGRRWKFLRFPPNCQEQLKILQHLEDLVPERGSRPGGPSRGAPCPGGGPGGARRRAGAPPPGGGFAGGGLLHHPLPTLEDIKKVQAKQQSERRRGGGYCRQRPGGHG